MHKFVKWLTHRNTWIFAIWRFNALDVQLHVNECHAKSNKDFTNGEIKLKIFIYDLIVYFISYRYFYLVELIQNRNNTDSLHKISRTLGLKASNMLCNESLHLIKNSLVMR